MANINPKDFTWTAPTKNTDGSDVVGELNYTLTVDGADFLSFPGSLNPDGKYTESTASMALPEDVEISVALKAFYLDEPSLISDPSGSLVIIMGVANPENPLDFSAV